MRGRDYLKRNDVRGTQAKTAKVLRPDNIPVEVIKAIALKGKFFEGMGETMTGIAKKIRNRKDRSRTDRLSTHLLSKRTSKALRAVNLDKTQKELKQNRGLSAQQYGF